MKCIDTYLGRESSTSYRDRSPDYLYEILISKTFESWYCSGKTWSSYCSDDEIHRSEARKLWCLSQYWKGIFFDRARSRSCLYGSHDELEIRKISLRYNLSWRSISYWGRKKCLFSRKKNTRSGEAWIYPHRYTSSIYGESAKMSRIYENCECEGFENIKEIFLIWCARKSIFPQPLFGADFLYLHSGITFSGALHKISVYQRNYEGYILIYISRFLE